MTRGENVLLEARYSIVVRVVLVIVVFFYIVVVKIYFAIEVHALVFDSAGWVESCAEGRWLIFFFMDVVDCVAYLGVYAATWEHRPPTFRDLDTINVQRVASILCTSSYLELPSLVASVLLLVFALLTFVGIDGVVFIQAERMRAYLRHSWLLLEAQCILVILLFGPCFQKRNWEVVALVEGRQTAVAFLGRLLEAAWGCQALAAIVDLELLLLAAEQSQLCLAALERQRLMLKQI